MSMFTFIIKYHLVHDTSDQCTVCVCVSVSKTRCGIKVIVWKNFAIVMVAAIR